MYLEEEEKKILKIVIIMVFIVYLYLVLYKGLFIAGLLTIPLYLLFIGLASSEKV